MTKYIFITDEELEKIKNGEVIDLDEEYTAFGMKRKIKLLHKNQYEKFKAGEVE